jgi:hypothetical protein
MKVFPFPPRWDPEGSGLQQRALPQLLNLDFHGLSPEIFARCAGLKLLFRP